VAKDLSPEKIRAYRIADNKTADLAVWDYELLPIELSALQGMDFDLELLGFSKDVNGGPKSQRLAEVCGGLREAASLAELANR
jgi:hypothetical protein